MEWLPAPRRSCCAPAAAATKKAAARPAPRAAPAAAAAYSGASYAGGGGSGGGGGGSSGGEAVSGPVTGGAFTRGPARYVLTITWTTPGRRPSTSDTTFTTAKACEAAVRDILSSAARDRADRERAAGEVDEEAPRVTAVCTRA